ncbi:MAG: GNAT family N-acetyltransferase [Pseudomonadota bacterium]|nr:GNAT family N-acetyltransferase [Pseudomonadota bacterium]
MIKVRNAEVTDALEMGTLHTLSWQVAYKGIISQPLLDAIDPYDRISKWRMIVEQKHPSQIILVAEIDGVVVGLVSGADDHVHEGRYYMQALYVHPLHVGKGVGFALFNAFKDQVIKLGYRKIYCGVLQGNKSAIAFYQRQGGVLKSELLQYFKAKDGQQYPEEICFFDF